MLTIKNPDSFDWKNLDLDTCVVGNANDVLATINLYHDILELLKEKNLEVMYDKILSPAVTIFAESEYEGLDIDETALDVADKKLSEQLEELEKQLKDLADRELNINSDQQLSKLVYEDEDGFCLVPIKFTAKGAISLDADVLKTTKAIILSEIGRRKLDA